MKKNDEGFTLIELLIVIVILGILAAVVVFAVGGITDKGEVSACKADFKTVEVAMEAYYAQEAEYPTSFDQLLTNNTGVDPKSLKLLNSEPEYASISGADGDLVFTAGVNATDQASFEAAGCNAP